MNDDLPQRNPGSNLPFGRDWLPVATTMNWDDPGHMTYSRDEETMRRIAEKLTRWPND